MTKYEEHYGSLSPALETFLEMTEKKRNEVYGKNKAKNYQRVVLNVQESFSHAVFAYGRLPPEYSKKIDLNMGFYMIQKEIIKQKSPKDRANFAISQARQALRVITVELGYPDYFIKLFYPDFEKVQNWLVVLDKLEPELKIKK